MIVTGDWSHDIKPPDHKIFFSNLQKQNETPIVLSKIFGIDFHSFPQRSTTIF
jgi:hypothetical protein